MNASSGSIVRFLQFTGFSTVLLFPSVVSAATVDESSNAWQNLGLTFDFLGDQQTGSAAGDIVGVGIDYGFFTTFNPGMTTTDGELGFRVRLGDEGVGGEFGRVLWVGVDANLDGSVDAFFGVINQGATDELNIRDAGAGANTSPNTTTISNTASFTYAFSPTNYNYRPVDFTTDGGTTNDLANTATPDFYVSFMVPFQDLVTFLGTQGIAVDSSSAIRYVVGTSTQANSLNQDIGGIDGGLNSPVLWSDAGFGPLITFSGTIIPEPDFAALLGAFGILLLARRRR